MASKYDGLARIIIQNVGGKENITGITHCITRLRFVLKDESKANTEILKETDGVVSVIQAGGQYQVVIGNHVEHVFDSVISVGHLESKALKAVDEDGSEVEESNDTGSKKSPLNTFIDVVSGILSPTLGVLGAAGIVKGLLAMLSYFHILGSDSGTYQILYAFGDGFFYFLPIILGYTTAKKFKMNEFIGMAIGVGLVYPNMVELKGAEALGTIFASTPFEMSYTTRFLGLPIFFPASGYTASVVPVILTVWFASKVYKAARKIVPELIQLFIVPIIVVGVSLPVCYFFIGPLSGVLCGILQFVFNLIYNLPLVGGALAGAFVAGIWQICVMFGLHWGLLPLMFINMSTLGYDFILPPNTVCAWSQVAALAAILIATRDDKLKKVAIPALVSAIFGVTEPAIYGVTLPKKKPFIISCVCSALGGGIVGAFHVKKFTNGGLGLFNLPNFIDPSGVEGISNLLVILAAMAVTMALTFIVVRITWKDGKETAKKKISVTELNAKTA